ncbi:conserved Plasmodium protein, unknown function [Plasmodium ovale curtisi]|nr:conserved Plasmodium protein, unknown function [Plasmodium ovale curtisi]SBS81380.1 conserved Plasmodium protein, unknown function [Plasmodium ovale curtisi]
MTKCCLVKYSRGRAWFSPLFRKKSTAQILCSRAFFSSLSQGKHDLIKHMEESYNLEEAFIRRISKMNNTALAYTCEDINKKRINNRYIWELVYNRINEIKKSFSINELVVIFHAYCHSISFDINFSNYINLFWDLLGDKIKDLDYLSLIGLYFCSEKTGNAQKMEEISNFLLTYILEDCTQIKVAEKGLAIILKILCYTKKTVDDKHIYNVSNFIQNVDIKEIKNIILCLHFFVKFKLFNKSFVILLKKIQSLIIFKKINYYMVFKYLCSIYSMSKNSTAMQEVKRTLSIIYLSHRINNCP